MFWVSLVCQITVFTLKIWRTLKQAESLEGSLFEKFNINIASNHR